MISDPTRSLGLKSPNRDGRSSKKGTPAMRLLSALALLSTSFLARGEYIVEIYDLLHVYNNQSKQQVFLSDEIYSFPWNTNVREIQNATFLWNILMMTSSIDEMCD